MSGLTQSCFKPKANAWSHPSLPPTSNIEHNSLESCQTTGRSLVGSEVMITVCPEFRYASLTVVIESQTVRKRRRWRKTQEVSSPPPLVLLKLELGPCSCAVAIVYTSCPVRRRKGIHLPHLSCRNGFPLILRKTEKWDAHTLKQWVPKPYPDCETANKYVRGLA